MYTKLSHPGATIATPVLYPCPCQVVDNFDMCQRTAFLAVAYTDLYLHRPDITMQKRRLQLLGASCLHVASKCEDVSYIGNEDLANCADNVFTPADVLDMEETVRPSPSLGLLSGFYTPPAIGETESC
jgi:hypothetical protein